MTSARSFPIILVLTVLMGITPSHAQFVSGSNGTDGALLLPAAVPNVTLNVPEPDGIFNYTTITIEAGVTLTFTPNSLNTPVYMLATGDVDILGNIYVNGKDGTSSPPAGGLGGPGGYAGGMPGLAGSPPGAGQGPGGGLPPGGKGVYNLPPGSPTANDGAPYGTPLLVPLVGGSGSGGTDGSPGNGGGGGGGALLIGSSTQITVGGGGRIQSLGGGPYYLAGSSGAIRLVANKVAIAPGGFLEVYGASGYGSAGRIRVDTINRRELFTNNINPISCLSVGGFMRVFPDPTPRLDITQAAGKNIPEGTTEAVSVFLPLNSPPSQQVKVQARDFEGMVPIRVVLTPDSGLPVIQDATFDMGMGNPSTLMLMMDFPINTPTFVQAFTK